MPLKLGPITDQVQEMIATATLPDQDDLMAQAQQLLHSLSPLELRQRLEAPSDASLPWPAALPVDVTADSLAVNLAPPPPPTDFSVVAADGSAIPPDRHNPLDYYLINTGYAVLTYGHHPQATLDSSGRLYFKEEDLYLTAQEQRVPISDARLSLKMQIQEMQTLLQAAGQASPPGVALRDGSLIIWPLQSEARFVQDYFLQRFLACLDGFRRAAFPIASYISYPDGLDVVGALRVWLCTAGRRDCAQCASPQEQRALCTFLRRVRDRHLFAALLADGARSQVFASTSAILERYGEHSIRFFYLNVGGEIARIEAPAWVTDDAAMLDRLHAVVVDQCRRSGSYPPYPPALMEAHEQAVINTADRHLVQDMVEQAMAQQGHTFLRSAKERSKRTRAV